MGSLIDFGLTHCRFSFGDSFANPARNYRTANIKTTADGAMAFAPKPDEADAVFDKLDLLLTGGPAITAGR